MAVAITAFPVVRHIVGGLCFLETTVGITLITAGFGTGWVVRWSTPELRARWTRSPSGARDK